MLNELVRAEFMYVPDYGQIGAGSVVPFTPSGRTRIVRPRTARSFDRLVSYVVSGDSMEGDRIFDGDRVTCRENFEMSEIKNGKIVVAKIPGNDLVIKRFYLLSNGMIKLHSSNPNYKDCKYELNDVEVVALVIEVSRSLI